jgi:hypothetical protein
MRVQRDGTETVTAEDAEGRRGRGQSVRNPSIFSSQTGGDLSAVLRAVSAISAVNQLVVVV